MRKEIDQGLAVLTSLFAVEAAGYAISATTRVEQFLNQQSNPLAELVLFLQNNAGIPANASLVVIAAWGAALTLEAFDNLDQLAPPIETSTWDTW